jgi:hypothetical protein
VQVLAFRGTANLKNIATDIKIAQTPLPELRPKGRGRIIIHCSDSTTATAATADATAAAGTSSSSTGGSSGATQQQCQSRRRRTSRTATAAAAAASGTADSNSNSEVDASLNSSVVYDSEYQQQQQQHQQQSLLSGSTDDDELEDEGLYSAIEQFPEPAEQLLVHSDGCSSGDDYDDNHSSTNNDYYNYNDEQQQERSGNGASQTDVSDDVSALLFDNRGKGGLCWHMQYCLKAVVTRLPVFRQALPRVHSGFLEAYMRYLTVQYTHILDHCFVLLQV